MCGIAGIITSTERNLDAIASRMISAIRYRGPDDSGTWCDEKAGVGLGHARLSILDVSPAGHQPMVSASGRFVMTYNGEVYNFGELRPELEAKGARFRGHSDTEVMLEAFEQWGVENAVQRFVGMFAFAVWDRRERVLHLVRDRLGIKPLYFGWIQDAFLFASELKAICTYTKVRPEIDRDALPLFMRYGYVPAPRSIYRNMYKLMPGCILTVPLDQTGKPQDFSPEPEARAPWKPVRYWSAKQVAEQGIARPFQGDEKEAIDELDDLLREAVKLRMISDVPLGAFLSGGIDSSTVVALMQAQSSLPIKTFTIGFHELEFNEAQHAKKVARHLGTDHTELYVTPSEAMAVIPRLHELYDEPFADSSQIPTLLVSQLARRSVTVTLSGDGGDELFGGYNRYFWGSSLWSRLCRVPTPIRRVLAEGITSFRPMTWDRLFQFGRHVLPAIQSPGDRLHKLAQLLSVRDLETLYRGLVSLWREPSTVDGAKELLTTVTDPSQWADLADFTQRMMYLDMVTYLPDDILAKVDRATMAVSLEGRVPLLDHRVVEYAWRLPLNLKVRREGEGKWILRRVLERHVPRELVERPKMGFGVPIDSWLRGPLRDWAESLLDEQRLKQDGFLDPMVIRTRWHEHLSGQRNWQYPLWAALMFQAWVAE